MFLEGTYTWEAMTLDGRKINRETAGVSAHQLDPATLRWFSVVGKNGSLFGKIEVEAGINVNGLALGSFDVLITDPKRFSQIIFTKRKTFPMDMSSPVREIYLLKLTEGAEQIVIVVEPQLIRVLRKEPNAEVA